MIDKMQTQMRLWKLRWILLFVLKLSEAAVDITHNEMICGQTATLTCTVDPLNDIRWDRDTSQINLCYTTGSCVVSSSGDYIFTMNNISSFSTLTISPITYSVYQNSTFACSSLGVSSSVTLDIPVPMFNLSIEENQVGNSTECIVSTNCVKTDVGVTFAWSYVSVNNESIVIGDNCDISNTTSSGSTTGCSSGDACLGTGLETKRNVLTFTNYNGTATSNTVKLAVTATYGTTVLTTTSTNTYSIQA